MRSGIAAFVDAGVEQPELYRATLLRSAAVDEAVRLCQHSLRAVLGTAVRTAKDQERLASIG